MDHRWQKPGDCLAFRSDETYPILLGHHQAFNHLREPDHPWVPKAACWPKAASWPNADQEPGWILVSRYWCEPASCEPFSTGAALALALVSQSFFNSANPIVIIPESLAMLAKRIIIFLKRFASGPIQIGLLALLLAVGCHSAGLAGVMGGVTPVPYPEVVERSRLAAKAVLERRGAEACLRGKLTGALLALSASCEAEARQTPLCALAERAVVSSDWRLATMDATALAILAQPA